MSQKKMRWCECRDIILDHVRIGDLCDLVREYAAEMPAAKLNAAINRSKKFEFTNGLGAYLVISYEDGQLCFGRSSNSKFNRITMYCDTDRVAYLLQDPDIMDVVCSHMLEITRCKEYLARLGARLDKILMVCHDALGEAS